MGRSAEAADAMTVLEKFLKAHNFAGDGPLVSTSAGRGDLTKLFALLGYTVGAEIGVWEGAFARVICDRVPGVRLTCVDPWKAYDAYREQKNDQQRLDAAYRSTRERLKSFPCTILRQTSTSAAAAIADRSMDFIYIDANHAEAFVRQDLEAWVPKVRSGGIVAGHDYHLNPRKPFIQVKPAVDAFVKQRGMGPVYVLGADKSPSFFWVVA